MNRIKMSVLACFLLFVNNNMQAQEPCWFTKPPISKNSNFVYVPGIGIGNVEKIRFLAEADAIRRFAAEVSGVDIPDATYKEILEKGLRNAKIAGIPVQYRVIRQQFENNNYYILLLLPRRFSTDPRSIIYPVEEICARPEGIRGNMYETMEIGESSPKIGYQSPADFEFIITERGRFTISLKTEAEYLWFALYDKYGTQLKAAEQLKPTAGSFSKTLSGLQNWSKIFPINRGDRLEVYRCEWSPTKKFIGSFTFILDADTYYLRFIRSATGSGEIDLTTQFIPSKR